MRRRRVHSVYDEREEQWGVGHASWWIVGIRDPEFRQLYLGPDRASPDAIADWYERRYGARPIVAATVRHGTGASSVHVERDKRRDTAVRATSPDVGAVPVED